LFNLLLNFIWYFVDLVGHRQCE